MNLKGDTGPLVYPAGFLYLFSGLKAVTEDGQDIFKGQIIFAAMYIVVLAVVLRLYTKGNAVHPSWFLLLILSKRVHSIFMLRMFNDCAAVLLGYLALYAFTEKRWYLGSFLYSGAVSIKMNMLLYAPGVLFCMLVGCGLPQTVVCLVICASLQIFLGFPFLSTYPVEYIKRAFDLGRVFMFKWTVNFKFLPEDVFVSKPLSVILLLLTACAFGAFAAKWIRECKAQMKRSGSSKGLIAQRQNLSSNFILVTIFSSNFIGIAFARSLHYQFYCWYFHTLPYLLWHARSLPTFLKLLILLGVEISFNVYPATAWSSLLLQSCHAILLVSIYLAPVPNLTKSIKSE